MAGFTAVEIINRPPEEVFDFMTDLFQLSRWVSGLISVDPITRGSMREGSKWSEIRRIGDREASNIIEVEAFRKPGEGKLPPYVYAIRSVHLGIQSTYHYRVDVEDREQTRIELTAVVRGANFISNFFAPFAATGMKRRDQDQLKSLKKAVEALPVHQMILDVLADEPPPEPA